MSLFILYSICASYCTLSTSQWHTVQNQNAKRVNCGIRPPTDITYVSLRPCSSILYLLLDMAFGFSTYDVDADSCKILEYRQGVSSSPSNPVRGNELPESRLLPFDVIEAATTGDSEALQVLKHFEGYIAEMSTRIFYDEFGQSCLQVDDDLKQRIECKLMAQIILTFNIR